MAVFTSDTPWLTRFSSRRPAHETDQRVLLDWLADAHAASAAARDGLSAAAEAQLRDTIRRVTHRCACSPAHIRRRGHVLRDIGSTAWSEHAIYDLRSSPRGRGLADRARVFEGVTTDYFAAEYAEERVAPADLVHVTCTGYVSPSAAQRLVARKGWNDQTRVTHAYHMGCYAAIPALRIASGALAAPASFHRKDAGDRVDVVHTELCSLHFDPGHPSMEQLVVQSLFADGFIRYAVSREPAGPGLRVLALAETIVADSAGDMGWVMADFGMQMTLGRKVADRIGGVLRRFVDDLYRRAGLAISDLARSVGAIHPGGPRIIDRVREILELDESQVRISREVLRDFGNMSSATLPHVWQRIVDDPAVPAGAPVLSLAFGPGLTICGAVLEKGRGK